MKIEKVTEAEAYSKAGFKGYDKAKAKTLVGIGKVMIPLSAVLFELKRNVRDVLSNEYAVGAIASEKAKEENKAGLGLLGSIAFAGKILEPLKIAYDSKIKGFEILRGNRRAFCAIILQAQGYPGNWDELPCEVIGFDMTEKEKLAIMADHGDSQPISAAGLAESVRRMLLAGYREAEICGAFPAFSRGKLQPHIRLARIGGWPYDLWVSSKRPEIEGQVTPHFRAEMVNELATAINDEVKAKGYGVGGYAKVLAENPEKIAKLKAEILKGKGGTESKAPIKTDKEALSQTIGYGLVPLQSVFDWLADKSSVDWTATLASVRECIGRDTWDKAQKAFTPTPTETSKESEKTEAVTV